ncbi:MAG: hypothetical protein AVDCRST_MAG83-3382 [uncultured Arthrobacter sp.]|uniref:Glucose/Sorbosone dehydrogenase domain-containing protein n=1 Tax=uncultured Arthrobacter sp. TaxID=114050 RepID=A0A6J4J867_9MICC|nr:hypothetical protein [uncultured Arthrobacter sp.]CAA9272883.1 MAG: hypothetical protein AVDCRST_MAG83-3382 [uncultured Arthrobacter sp.]
MDPDAAETRLFVNDVGGKRWEEIDEAVVGPEGAGNDYGWNVCEGDHDNPYRSGRADCSGSRFTGPIHEYNHNTGCESLTGGAFVPDGAFSGGYDDSYLFGDYVCGKIFELTPNGTGGYDRAEFAAELGPGGPIALDFGPDGADGRCTTRRSPGADRRCPGRCAASPRSPARTVGRAPGPPYGALDARRGVEKSDAGNRGRSPG